MHLEAMFTEPYRHSSLALVTHRLTDAPDTPDTLFPGPLFLLCSPTRYIVVRYVLMGLRASACRQLCIYPTEYSHRYHLGLAKTC